MAKLSFKVNPPLLVEQQVSDAGGNWKYVGANATEETSGEAVTLIAMKRDNTSGEASFAASMLTATIMFSSHEHGVPEHFTVQGLHDLTSENEIGSVSSASRRFTNYIGGTFTFDHAKGVLSVFSRK
jgi:hypothetical protein